MMPMSDNSCKEKTFVLLSQNLIRDRKFLHLQIGHYITMLMYCLNIQKEQIHLLGYSTIFFNYQLQFRARKSIQKYLDLCSKSI